MVHGILLHAACVSLQMKKLGALRYVGSEAGQSEQAGRSGDDWTSYDECDGV